VRISPDDNIARTGKGLDDYLVADTLARLGYKATTLTGKVTQEYVVIRQLPAGTGRGVVNKNGRLMRVGQPGKAACLKLPDGQRAGGILHKAQVYLGDNDVPGPGIAAGLFTQYLFGYCLAHGAGEPSETQKLYASGTPPFPEERLKGISSASTLHQLLSFPTLPPSVIWAYPAVIFPPPQLY
jgi:hypothetical protein